MGLTKKQRISALEATARDLNTRLLDLEYPADIKGYVPCQTVTIPTDNNEKPLVWGKTSTSPTAQLYF